MSGVNHSALDRQIRVDNQTIKVTGATIALHEVGHAYWFAEKGYELESVSIGLQRDDQDRLVGGLVLITQSAFEKIDSDGEATISSNLAGPAAEFLEVGEPAGVGLTSYMTAQLNSWGGDLGESYLCLRPELAGKSVDPQMIVKEMEPYMVKAIDEARPIMDRLRWLTVHLIGAGRFNNQQFLDLVAQAKAELP